MLLRDFIQTACESLCAVYPAREARSIVSLYCQEVLGVENYTHIVEPDYEIPDGMVDRVVSDCRLLAQGRPVQQVLGYAWFCGRRFRVTPDVLIPRPETEGLVQLALTGLPPAARVLDLCTGSGCIAWSLGFEGTYTVGVDVSGAALEVARSQFDNSGPERPLFLQADILGAEWWKDSGLEEGSFDLLVSNPPYIMESEKKAMLRNVLEYEPELALFVPDEDPLLFYRAIAHSATALLKAGGRGIVEINEALGEGTAAVFTSAGFSSVRTLPDFFGKERFVEFRKG